MFKQTLMHLVLTLAGFVAACKTRHTEPAATVTPTKPLPTALASAGKTCGLNLAWPLGLANLDVLNASQIQAMQVSPLQCTPVNYLGAGAVSVSTSPVQTSDPSTTASYANIRVVASDGTVIYNQPSGSWNAIVKVPSKYQGQALDAYVSGSPAPYQIGDASGPTHGAEQHCSVTMPVDSSAAAQSLLSQISSDEAKQYTLCVNLAGPAQAFLSQIGAISSNGQENANFDATQLTQGQQSLVAAAMFIYANPPTFGSICSSQMLQALQDTQASASPNGQSLVDNAGSVSIPKCPSQNTTKAPGLALVGGTTFTNPSSLIFQSSYNICTRIDPSTGNISGTPCAAAGADKTQLFNIISNADGSYSFATVGGSSTYCLQYALGGTPALTTVASPDGTCSLPNEEFAIQPQVVLGQTFYQIKSFEHGGSATDPCFAQVPTPASAGGLTLQLAPCSTGPNWSDQAYSLFTIQAGGGGDANGFTASAFPSYSMLTTFSNPNQCLGVDASNPSAGPPVISVMPCSTNTGNTSTQFGIAVGQNDNYVSLMSTLSVSYQGMQGNLCLLHLDMNGMPVFGADFCNAPNPAVALKFSFNPVLTTGGLTAYQIALNDGNMCVNINGASIGAAPCLTTANGPTGMAAQLFYINADGGPTTTSNPLFSWNSVTGQLTNGQSAVSGLTQQALNGVNSLTNSGKAAKSSLTTPQAVTIAMLAVGPAMLVGAAAVAVHVGLTHRQAVERVQQVLKQSETPAATAKALPGRKGLPTKVLSAVRPELTKFFAAVAVATIGAGVTVLAALTQTGHATITSNGMTFQLTDAAVCNPNSPDPYQAFECAVNQAATQLAPIANDQTQAVAKLSSTSN